MHTKPAIPPVQFIDTTLRDGNQSLWGATGLRTGMMLAIAPVMDAVGWHALDFTTSTHMAVAVRFHKENPWERLRRVKAGILSVHRHALHLMGNRPS